MTANKTVAVNSQSLRTSKITLRYRAGWAVYLRSSAVPRLPSISSMTTREIEVSADSDAAKKPAKTSRAIMLTIAMGLINLSATL